MNPATIAGDALSPVEVRGDFEDPLTASAVSTVMSNPNIPWDYREEKFLLAAEKPEPGDDEVLVHSLGITERRTACGLVPTEMPPRLFTPVYQDVTTITCGDCVARIPELAIGLVSVAWDIRAQDVSFEDMLIMFDQLSDTEDKTGAKQQIVKLALMFVQYDGEFRCPVDQVQFLEDVPVR